MTSTIRRMTSRTIRRMTSTIRGMISTCPDQPHHQDHPVGWLPEPCKNRTSGICHQSFRMPPRIDDLGLGELPVDSTQDRALAGLLCAGNGVRLKPGESGRWRSMLVDAGRWFWYWVRMRGVFWCCSGAALVLLWGSSRWMGACAVISGVIVSPAVISGPAIGCVNSFPFVRWFWFWFWFWWWWMRRYAPPIWCDDMHHRYALPICKAGKQKRPRAYALGP